MNNHPNGLPTALTLPETTAIPADFATNPPGSGAGGVMPNSEPASFALLPANTEVDMSPNSKTTFTGSTQAAPIAPQPSFCLTKARSGGGQAPATAVTTKPVVS
jgi:hypothetical protein